MLPSAFSHSSRLSALIFGMVFLSLSAGGAVAEPVPGAAVAPRVTHGEAARVLKSLELPAAAHRARQAGVGENDLLPILTLLDEADSAETASDVISEQAAAAEDGQGATGLGEFVTQQVQSGMRGRELAQAIRTERERRRQAGEHGAADGSHRHDGLEGSGHGGGRPDGAGRPEGSGQGGGRPDGAGRGRAE